MTANKLSLAMLLLGACDSPRSGTQVGNGVFVEIVARGEIAGLTLEEAALNIQAVSSSPCDGDDEHRLKGSFQVDLASDEATRLGELAASGEACALTLSIDSFSLNGTFADDVAIGVAIGSFDVRIGQNDLAFDIGGPEELLFVAFERSEWLAGLDLAALKEEGHITIDETTHPEHQETIADGVANSTTIHNDSDHDEILDDSEHAKDIAHGEQDAADTASH